MGDDALGQWVVRAAVWIALLCYPAGPFGFALAGSTSRRLARVVWTLGCLAFTVHAVGSFAVFYDWSHAVAVRETGRQVAEVTGRPFGAGIYLNYLFLAIWVVDASRWWIDERRYLSRPWIGVLAMHGFFLFMILNGTVVFERGAIRALGVVVTLLGGAGTWMAVRRLRSAG